MAILGAMICSDWSWLLLSTIPVVWDVWYDTEIFRCSDKWKCVCKLLTPFISIRMRLDCIMLVIFATLTHLGDRIPPV